MRKPWCRGAQGMGVSGRHGGWLRDGGFGGGRSLEAQVGQGGPPGEEPPEIDEEQAHAGDDGRGGGGE